MTLLAAIARPHRRPPPKVPWYKPLFLTTEVGMVWDFTDISTLYQDTAHTIPCTAVGQTIGSIRDLITGAYAILTGTAWLKYDNVLGLYCCETGSTCDFASTGTVPAALGGNGLLTFVSTLRLINTSSTTGAQYMPCYIGPASPSSGNAIALVQWYDPTATTQLNISLLQYGGAHGRLAPQQSGVGVLIGRKNNGVGVGSPLDIWWNGTQVDNAAIPSANPLGAITTLDYHICKNPNVAMNIYRSAVISRPITTTEIASVSVSALQ